MNLQLTTASELRPGRSSEKLNGLIYRLGLTSRQRARRVRLPESLCLVLRLQESNSNVSGSDGSVRTCLGHPRAQLVAKKYFFILENIEFPQRFHNTPNYKF